jgi:hypothetical protein
MTRQLTILVVAFAAGTAVAAAFGAANLGAALAVGQHCFAGALVFVLLLGGKKSSRSGDAGRPERGAHFLCVTRPGD